MKPAAPDEEIETAEVSAPLPKVTNNFYDYTPPFNVAALVERMLASVPSKYLVGLSEVVLTNTAGLPRKVRRSMTKSRKRKVKVVEARGLYYQAWKGRPAWIKIFVDNTLRRLESGWWLKFGYFRENELGTVLFHEIGHHIHYTLRPEYREREDVADDWGVKLRRNWFKVRRPWLRRFLRIIRPFLRVVARWEARRLLREGRITRAEFERHSKKSES